MFKAILGVYLIIGVLSLFYRRDILKENLEAQGSWLKILMFQIVITLGAVILWASRLAGMSEKKPENIQILLEVSEQFKEVAEERGETIDRDTMVFISSKFILMNKQVGAYACREHLKHELEKYKNEGLREDYIMGGAASKLGQ